MKYIAKILKWILLGRGIGLRYLFVLALLIAGLLSWRVYSFVDSVLPDFQILLDEVTPLKIRNGVVVEPTNVFKSIPLISTNTYSHHFVLDTTRDTIEEVPSDTLSYLTRTKLYARASGKTTVYDLPNELTLDRADHIPEMKCKNKVLASIILFFGTIVLFVKYLISVVFFAWVGKLSALIAKRRLDMWVRMRLTTAVFVLLQLVTEPIQPNFITFFLLMIVLQILAMKGLPEQIEEKTDTKVSA